jgi:hypothetical protein
VRRGNLRGAQGREEQKRGTNRTNEGAGQRLRRRFPFHEARHGQQEGGAPPAATPRMPPPNNHRHEDGSLRTRPQTASSRPEARWPVGGSLAVSAVSGFVPG